MRKAQSPREGIAALGDVERRWEGPSRPRLRKALAPTMAAIMLASLAFGEAALAVWPLGPRAAHMAAHIFLMNALAPALALATLANCGERAQLFASGRLLVVASAVQLTLLWSWHAPKLFTLALAQPAVHGLMQASLLAASFLFWLAILSEKGVFRWRGIVALALTGKISCLLGVLLLFAPRPLFADVSIGDSHGALNEEGFLLDQRLAGLMMLVACPLCYVLGGVSIAAKWLRDLEAADAGRRATFFASL